jgi:hypothetical protein
MRSLYEVMRGSLLDDIDDILSDGDEKAPAIVANMQDSDLRTFFSIAARVETPFEFSDGGSTLIVKPQSRVLRPLDVKLNDFTIDNVDTLICKSGLTYIWANPSERLCPCLKADSFHFNEFAAVTFKDMEIHAGNYSGDKTFPNIFFNSGKASAELTNSRLEIDYSITKSALVEFIGDIPIFNNVKSDTVQRIEVTDRYHIQFSDKTKNVIANPFGNKRWDKLFEFGYDLEEKRPNYGNKIKIKSMKDFRKLVASRNFWNYEFDQFPYRLKKGAKLSDFIDISGFKNLHNIQIHDNKMNVLFINTKLSNIRSYVGHVSASLKQNVRITNLIYDIPYPITADGWMVIINLL